MHTEVSYIEIDASDGQRVDNFLFRHLSNIPKSHIYRILRKGEVRVNKGRVKPTYKLKDGDILRVPPLDRAQKPLKIIESGGVKLEAIYEDEHYIVVNKPSGLAVHGGIGTNLGLIEVARNLWSRSLELVHRLDKDTSGCLLLAKNRQVLRKLHELFRERTVTKHYHAILRGYCNDKFIVNAKLQRKLSVNGERMVSVHPEGQSARTEFEVIERLRQASLVLAKPITGRTHQIRVHADSLGHPILGDIKYGRNNKASRLCLHARQLMFECPITNQLISVIADYDEHMQNILTSLQR